jgi:hypothetical protein
MTGFYVAFRELTLNAENFSHPVHPVHPVQVFFAPFAPFGGYSPNSQLLPSNSYILASGFWLLRPGRFDLADAGQRILGEGVFPKPGTGTRYSIIHLARFMDFGKSKLASAAVLCFE